MNVKIKLVALLLYLILATKAAPMGNGKAGGGENEGAEAGEAGGEGEAGEAGEQGEVGKAGKQGEIGDAKEMGEEKGLAEGGEIGEKGENAVTVKLPTAIVKSQPPTGVTPTNEEPEATSFVTEAATNKQRAGVSGSVLPEVAPYTPEMSTVPLVTPDDFNYLDKNGDGFLDYRELVLGQNSYSLAYLNAAFQISDKNFDGVVDQREFFRHPLSWGRVVAEKQFFAKDISTSGVDATENVTSQSDVTPTVEQTYTASPDGTSPQLPKDNVTTTVASAEQSTTGLTAVNQQLSFPTDTSTTGHVNVDGVVDQREFFRHPLSWGRVVAEKSFFAKDISTSGTGASENVTSQPDVTPTVEQTYTANPDGTSPQLPEYNVTTTVASAEQNTTDLTVPDQQTSVLTDTSTTVHVSVVDNANGGHSVVPAKGNTVQTIVLPIVTQGRKEGASQKAGSQVGSKAGAATGSIIGHPARGKAVDHSVGTGVVPNGGQPTVRKGGAVADSTGDQAGKATGQKDQKRSGAGSFGGQPSGVPGSVGGHGQGGQHGQKRGQAGLAGSMGSQAITVKSGGHAMWHGVQHRTTAATRRPGVQSGVSVHPGGNIRGHTVAYGHLQTVPVSWPWKAQGHVKPQYHPALELVKLENEGTKADAQSEEEEDGEESSNEAEDKKNKNKNGKGNGVNEYDNTEDNDENDKK